MKEKDIELLIKNRIDEISKSGALEALIVDLSNKFSNLEDAQFNFRLKDINSAVTKFHVEGYSDIRQLTDLAGAMAVTSSVDEVYKIADYISKNYKVIGETNDYIKSPKFGYQSYHINVEIKGFPIELQIKTHSMKFAQKMVHDKIYKNYQIPMNVRNELCVQTFPVLAGLPYDIAPFITKSFDNLVLKCQSFNVKDSDIKEFVSKNVGKFKLAICKEIKLNLNNTLNKITAIKDRINNIESVLNRLSKAEYWLKDYESNIAELRLLSKPINKLKMLFSKSLKSKHDKILSDIDLDKKFLKEMNINSKTDYIDQSEKYNIQLLDNLNKEYNSLVSQADKLYKAFDSLNVSKDFDKSMDKSIEFSRSMSADFER